MNATGATPVAPKNSVRNESSPAPAHGAVEDHHDDLPKNLKKPNLLIVIAVAILFLVLLAGLFVVGYLAPSPRPGSRPRPMPISPPMTPISSPSRNRAPPSGAKEILLACDIQPFQDTLIFSARQRLSGSRLNVDIGDHVQKDQVLAEIDAPEVDAQLVQAQAALQQANADVAKAQTDLELAQRSYERFASAAKGGNDVSQQEIDERATARDQAKAVIAQAQASVAAADANILRLKVMQSFDKILAPFAGTITARNYDVGALLAPSGGREMFRLQQSDTLRVFVNVPQVYATQIRTSQAASLTVRNFLNRTFNGTVTRTASAVNPSTRTMPFELQFPNPDNALVPGMYGQASLSVDSPPQALLVPVSAMLFNATGTQVAIVDNGKVHFQQVTIGRDLGIDLEVLDGLTPNSQVITNPGEAPHRSASPSKSPMLPAMAEATGGLP